VKEHGGERIVTPPDTLPVGRNEKCPCGSGRKYKQCCLRKDEEKARKAREKAAAKAEKEAEKVRRDAEKSGEKADEKDAAAGDAAAPGRGPKQTYQPWKKSATNTHAFQKVTTPRKVGGS
jgi:hypothetical protein